VRAGLSVRNYGFFIDLSLYNLPTADGGLVPSAYPSPLTFICKARTAWV
jgi:hypothetical protein